MFIASPILLDQHYVGSQSYQRHSTWDRNSEFPSQYAIEELSAARNERIFSSPRVARAPVANIAKRRMSSGKARARTASKPKSSPSHLRTPCTEHASGDTLAIESPAIKICQADESDRKELELCLRTHITTPSSNIDPFSTLSVRLDSNQQALLHFYMNSYWCTGYTFAPTLLPNPRLTSIQQAVSCPVMLQIVLARAALHQISLHDDICPNEKRRLEIAATHQRGAAVAMLRQRLDCLNRSTEDNNDIVFSTICMATFEYRFGPPESANLHFQACRHIMRKIGGPLKLQDRDMNRQALWFECVYGSAEPSFVFEPADASTRAVQLTDFLNCVAATWRSWSDRSVNGLKHGIDPLLSDAGEPLTQFDSNTMLYQFLSRKTQIKHTGQIYEDCSEASAQLASIIMYVQTLLDTMHDRSIMQTYSRRLEKKLHDQYLDESSAIGNLMWLMLTDVGIPDTDCAPRRWHVAGLMNAVKHLNSQSQATLKTWLLGFIRGDHYRTGLKFDLFAFSYVAGEVK